MSSNASPAAPTVETSRLRDVLDSLLPGRRVQTLSRRPAMYHSSFRMEELSVRLDDGAALELVFKDLGPRALLDDALRCKPPFLLDPGREIRVYRAVLWPHRLGPQFLGAVEDGHAGEYWLVIEKVEGVPLWQVGEVSAWSAAANWAAQTHALLERLGPALAGKANLIRYDESYYRRWAAQAAARCERSDDADAVALGRVLRDYERVVRRLLGLPVTFIHGEYHASNILVRDAAAGSSPVERVCPVDWEMAAVGPGLMDLADLTAGNWTEAQREEIVAGYREVAAASETFEEDLDYCRLHRAVQWLGWSDDWSPPREHRQDWLGEAVRIAERLGVGRSGR